MKTFLVLLFLASSFAHAAPANVSFKVRCGEELGNKPIVWIRSLKLDVNMKTKGAYEIENLSVITMCEYSPSCSERRPDEQSCEQCQASVDFDGPVEDIYFESLNHVQKYLKVAFCYRMPISKLKKI